MREPQPRRKDDDETAQERDVRFTLRGENRMVIAHDTMTFREEGSDTEVTYTPDFAFKGIARVVAPLLKPAFTRLGDEAEGGLAAALARL